MPQPYANSFEHLQQELSRVDLLLRRGVIIARSMAASSGGQAVPEELRGAVISEAQITSFLSSPSVLDDYWVHQESSSNALRAVDQRLTQLRQEIDDRL